MTQHWTPDNEAKLIKHWQDGLSARTIAGLMGKTRSSIIGKVDRLRKERGEKEIPARGQLGKVLRRYQAIPTTRGNNVEKPSVRDLAARRREAATVMWAEGLSISEIARRLDMAQSNVTRMRKRHPHLFPKRSGDRAAPNRKTVWEPVERLTGNEVAFVDIEPRQCRYPMRGEPGPDMLCCGAPVANDGKSPLTKSYCAHHMQIMTRKAG